MNPTRWPTVVRSGLRVAPAGLLFLALGLLAAAGTARAQELKIDAPRFRFDSAANTYSYENARITMGGLVLDARLVVINLNARELLASGDVRFREGPIFGTGDRLELNVDTGTGVIYSAHLYDQETKYYLDGEIIRRTGPRSFTVETCNLSTCTPREASWRVRAGRIDYEVGRFATGRNAVLEVGPVPIFWFPFLAWPTVEKRQSGFLGPVLEFRDNSLTRLRSGTRLALPYFIALGYDQDVTLSPEYISERGPALAADYRYAFVGDQHGQLRVWGIQETHFRTPADENDILPAGEAALRDRYPARFTLDFGHTQGFGGGSRLTLYAQASSDGQVRREYDGVLNYRPYRVFQGTFSQQASWGNAAVTLERRIEYTSESLYADDLRFTDHELLPTLLPRAIYNTGYELFDRVPLALDVDSFATRFTTARGIGGQVTGVQPALTMPISLFGVAELIPSAQRQFVEYAALTYGNPDTRDTALPAVGYAQDSTELELRLPFARVYPRASAQEQDIKHVITPRLIRTSVQDVHQPYAGHVVQPGFGLELATFRLDNQWLGRTKLPNGSEAITRLGTLNFAQRYNLLLEQEQFVSKGPPLPTNLETDPGQPLLPAILEGSITSRPISLGFLLRYHHQLGQVTETRISASGVVNPHSRLQVSYTQNDITYRTPDNKLNPAVTQLTFSGEMTTSDVISVGLSGTVNLRPEPAPLERRIENGLVFLDYHPGCYAVRFSYQEFLDSFVEQTKVQYLVERRFLITFNLGGLFHISSLTQLGTGETTVSPGL
ncbi:MAG: LPS-assembly protein LptD [Candidatus Lambdaproteobacteria bacterium]|nr:LPS-assembly protein LptD [Candidatus Lambdaproteobacteria bacterium]